MELLTDKNKRLFGDDYIKQIWKELNSSGKRASGKLANSLDYRIQTEREQITFIIDAEDYFKYVDDGRKPGSFPNIKAIEKWTQIKGINKAAAWPIAKSIYKFGIKPANISDKAERNIFNGPTFETLETNMAENIEQQIVDKINGK